MRHEQRLNDGKLSNLRPGRSDFVHRIRGLGNFLRTIVWRLKCNWLKINGRVRIPLTVRIWSPRRYVVLGDRVQFGENCLVHSDAEFGNDILIADNVAFVGRDDHRYDIVGLTIWDSPRGDKLKVIVEDDVWIGYGAIILSGCMIGRGSVIAAGSVVVCDIPRYSIAAGVPAKVIKTRFTNEQIRQHETILNYAKRTCQ